MTPNTTQAQRGGRRRDARIRTGYHTRAATTIRTLDAVSRTRALSEVESERLYQAIRDERRHLFQIQEGAGR